MRATKSFRPSLSNRVSRTRKVNTSSFPPSNLSPSRSLLGSQSDGNSKGNRSASPPASPSLPIPSRKKHDGNLSDTKTSVRLKKMDQSTLPRYGSMTDSSRMKKSQMTSNQSLSVGRMRRANTETDLKGLTRTNLLSTPRLSTRSRKGGNVSVSDSGSRMTTGGFSPWALSPQSPHLRTNKATCHLSDYESSFVKKRGSMSPFATCGHVSD